MDCGDGVQSFGRKKRDTGKTVISKKLAEKMVFDPNLGQEVILYDTPLRKQIFVDPGIKVNRFRDPIGNEEPNGLFAGDGGGEFNAT